MSVYGQEAPEAVSAPPAEEEAVAGLVERVVFHSEDTGFSVISVSGRGRGQRFNVVGNAVAVQVGQLLTATGKWVNHRKFGLQFSARQIGISAPVTSQGIRDYLASGAVKGIGPVMAGKLVGAFGSSVLEGIESEPGRLQEVDGIGPVRAKLIADAWGVHKAVREIMIFLHSNGLGTARAAAVYKMYGAKAIQVITENPYRLARDIRGIGFKTADAIAMRAGMPKDSGVRIRSGLHYLLSEAVGRGNCGQTLDALKCSARDLLGVEGELIDGALGSEVAAGEILADEIDGEQCMFIAPLYHAEQRVALLISELSRRGLPWRSIDVDRAIPWIAEQSGMSFAPAQAAAVRRAVSSKFLVVTGGPGVGKTTIVNAILKIVSALEGRIKLCAPTGRAAKRMSEATRHPAQTIHRLLAFDPVSGRFRNNEANPIKCDLLVVDEASMVDVPLMHALLKAVPAETVVLLVGDADQLPSVGPGRVLGDIIESGAVPVASLTEVFRQAAESRIIVNAHRINSGRLPDLSAHGTPSDFYFVPAEEPDKAASLVIELVAERIPGKFGFDPMRDIQVLSPMLKGPVGVRSLNLELQARLNPAGERTVEKFGWTFAAGDRVIQLVNDYDRSIFNGDIGFVSAVFGDNEEIAVEFDGREVAIPFEELDALMPAYAITVHKSQGSEYPAVVLPVMMQHYPMLQRNLIYTGITRGKQLVVLVGQKKAVRIAVGTTGRNRRLSRLKKLLA